MSYSKDFQYEASPERVAELVESRQDFPVLPAAARLDRLDLEDVVKDALMAYIRGPMVEKGLQGPLFALINTAGRVMFKARALG